MLDSLHAVLSYSVCSCCSYDLLCSPGLFSWILSGSRVSQEGVEILVEAGLYAFVEESLELVALLGEVEG